MRTMVLWIAIAALVAPSWAAEEKKPDAPAPAPAAPAASVADQKIADELKAFCKKWMGFLETRERDNKRGVKWQPDAAGVKGQYVGYSSEYDCTMKERSSNGTPVATIVYREYLYAASGASQDVAVAAPTIIDATEVTEIFRYTKGQWVY